MRGCQGYRKNSNYFCNHSSQFSLSNVETERHCWATSSTQTGALWLRYNSTCLLFQSPCTYFDVILITSLYLTVILESQVFNWHCNLLPNSHINDLIWGNQRETREESRKIGGWLAAVSKMTDTRNNVIVYYYWLNYHTLFKILDIFSTWTNNSIQSGAILHNEHFYLCTLSILADNAYEISLTECKLQYK